MFLSNTAVSVLLETLKQQKYGATGQRPPE
jgi:hypothetical protein